jgi:hypothetical protein
MPVAKVVVVKQHADPRESVILSILCHSIYYGREFPDSIYIQNGRTQQGLLDE